MKDRLPTYLELGKGEVIDSKGNTSKELDIVLNNRLYCPVVYNIGKISIYFVESVAVIFEVKSKLDKKEILDSDKKFVSLQPLERVYAEKATFVLSSSYLNIFLRTIKSLRNFRPTAGLSEIP